MNKKKILIILLVVLFSVAGVVYLLTPKRQPPIIVDAYPKDGQKDVFTDSDVEFVFNRELTSSEKERTKITISPEIASEQTWNAEVIKISPITEFSAFTNYEIEIGLDDTKLYSLTFVTLEFNKEQLEKIGQEQSQADLEFGKSLKQYISENPWYTSLPIDNSSYTIVFDFNKQSFRIRIKSTPANDVEKQKIVDQALTDLRNIGASEPISYYVLTL